MAEKKRAKKGAQKSAKPAPATDKASKLFTDEERAAMREYAQERKRAARGETADEETVVLQKIAGMQEPDRSMGRRLHAIIKATAPELSSRLWYGMPAYTKDGKVVCFFQDARKFKTRYATFGFSDKAMLDDGHMWPNSFALMELTSAEETRIAVLVKKAVGR